MEESNNEVLYLKEVTLSGYKSIKDINIRFQKGLNIIIGKNAAGKTNFIEFLNKNLQLEFEGLNNFSSNLIFEKGREISISAASNIQISEILSKNNWNRNIETTLHIEKHSIDYNKTDLYALLEELDNEAISFGSTLINHGTPLNYDIVDKPLSFTLNIGLKDISNSFFEKIGDLKTPYFVRRLGIDLYFKLLGINEKKDQSILNLFFKSIEPLNQILNKFTPIQEVRFSPNYSVFTNEKEGDFTINNLFLEFKLNGEWMPFSNLSDGTQRLFYLISEVCDNEDVNSLIPIRKGFRQNNNLSRIILIEEPELGIHPHQFQKLMEFLKIQSENKQIIITTHSPQALDAIDPDELNRIIIAYIENGKEGTKLRHLNEKELLKAQEYIKKEFLSDYWLYSDLEK